MKNKREQGKGLRRPLPKALVKKSLSIVKNHQNIIITKEFGMISAPPRGCMLNNSPKGIKRGILSFKNSTIPILPEAPQKSP